MPLLDNTIVLYYFLINLTFKNVKTEKNKHFTRCLPMMLHAKQRQLDIHRRSAAAPRRATNRN